MYWYTGRFIGTNNFNNELKLCTFFRYVNQLPIASIANIIHRVPPFQSRHIHDLAFVCPIARTNQYMYSFFPQAYNQFVEQFT